MPLEQRRQFPRGYSGPSPSTPPVALPRRNTTCDAKRLFLIAVALAALAPPTRAAAPPSRVDVQRLITQLGSDDFDEREAASRLLADVGAPALPALEKALRSEDLEIRRRAGRLIPGIRARVFGSLRQVRRAAWMDTVQKIPAHVYHTAFSPDGRSYLAGGDVGPLRLWDVKSGELLKEFTGHQGWTSAAAFTPDGKRLLSGATDRTLKLWDVSTGKEVRTLAGHTDWVQTVAVSPDGKLGLSGSRDKTLRLWELATGKELRRLEGHQAWCGGCFSPDGKRVLSYGGDGTVRLWEAATGKSLLVLAPFKGARPRGEEVCFRAFFLPGGRQFAGYAGWSTDTSLVTWDADGGKEVRRIDLGTDFLRDLTVSPDGRSFLSSHNDGSLRLSDLATGREVSRVRFERHLPRGMSFSPDGRHAASGSWRGYVYLFRLRD
jgi:Tol biopolymer transport system component